MLSVKTVYKLKHTTLFYRFNMLIQYKKKYTIQSKIRETTRRM